MKTRIKRFLNLIINLFVAANLVFGQAVFLLAPISIAQAQDVYDTTTTDSTYTDYTMDESTIVSTDTTSIDTTEDYTVDEYTTDESTIIFSDTDDEYTTSTDTNYILIMEFVSAPLEVSGGAVFSIQTSEEAEVEFFILKDGVLLSKYQAVHQGDKVYYFNWDTTAFENGQYAVKAYAVKSGYMDISKQIYVNVNNALNTDEAISTIDSSYNDSTYSDTYTQEDECSDFTADDASISEPLFITIVERLESPVAGDLQITANVSQPVDKVDFMISGPQSKTFAGVKKDENHYYFIWSTVEFPDGFYKLAIFAYQGANQAEMHDSIEIKNNFYDDNSLIQSIEEYYPEKTEYYPEEIIKPIEDQFIDNQIVEIMPECQKYGINTMEECEEFMHLPPECRDKGILTWPECDKYMMIPYECRQQGILDIEACKNYMNEYATPWECEQMGVITPEECSKILFNNSMPDECLEQGAATQEECDKILSNQVYLTAECDNAGIVGMEECDKYMMENFMPQECREQGAVSQEECNYILRDKYGNLDNFIKDEFAPMGEFEFFDSGYGLPQECLEQGAATPEECDKIMFIKNAPLECREAGIATPEECKKHMMLAHMPEECREAGAVSEQECEKIMFLKHAPKECVEAGISEPTECEKFMFKKHAPSDCLEAGITTEGACEKYMFEKYGGIENIPADKFPPECQKQGAKTPEECDKVMRKMYMPQECQDQGITSEQECGNYMELKYMPQECRDAGAKTRSECDRIMFKKYGPKECFKAGIEDEEQCDDFMFNKYAPQVVCRDIDGWQCKNSIKERHLGNIVAKQVQFQELREKAEILTAESVNLGDLEDMLDTAKEIIPFKDKEINFKILAAEEKLILDDSDNLIQTASVVLMIDSDKDGIPDDMEKRFNTDPFNADSDGDGYNDGDEIKNQYNPSGEGEFKKGLTPIDEAIIQNKTLGQPKTDGEVLDDLIVQDIVNTEKTGEQSGNEYSIFGQAEPNSVVTLYIYSDLPLVATAKVDEYGNWQYELSHLLNEGEHEVYVAVNDNTGKVVSKSKPLNFFIKEAKAVSVQDFVSIATPEAARQSESMIKYYMAIAVAMAVAGIALFVAFSVQRRKHFTT